MQERKKGDEEEDEEEHKKKVKHAASIKLQITCGLDSRVAFIRHCSLFFFLQRGKKKQT